MEKICIILYKISKKLLYSTYRRY